MRRLVCAFVIPNQEKSGFLVSFEVLMLVKLSPRTLIYSVDLFSYSGPSGILGSDGKQKTA